MATGGAATGRRGRGRRIVLGALAMAAAALVVAALSARWWVERALSQALAAPVSIGAVWIGPFADVTLVGVQLGAPGEGPSASRITVDPDFRRVVRGDWVVNQLAVTGLRATIEQGPEGTATLRGFALPTASEGGPRIDVRELVVRDGDLAGIPPPRFRREPVDLHVERLVARQAPTPTVGVSAFVGTLRGTLDGVPIRGDATAEIGGGERAIEASVEVAEAALDARALPLPPGVRSFAGTVSGSARYSLSSAAHREEIGADGAIAGFRLATDAGVEVAAGRLAAEGLTLDLARGWTWSARRLEIADARIAAAPGGRRLEIAIDRASLRDAGRDRSGRLEASAEAPGGGSMTLEGRLGIDPPAADLDVRADGVSLPEVAAALPPLPLAIARGTASASLHAASDGERHRVTGRVSASQVHTAPPSSERPDEVLAADRIDARVAYDSAAAAPLQVASLELQYPYAMVLRRAAGTFPLSALAAGAATPPAAPGDDTPGDHPPGGAPDHHPPGGAPDGHPPGDGATGDAERRAAVHGVAIAELRVVSGRIDFVDETVTPTYWAGLASLTGVASETSFPDLSVRRFSLTALHDELSPIAASGDAAGAVLRAKASAERLSAPSFNAYLSPILGYRAQSGTVGLSVDGSLGAGTFTADTHLTMQDLTVVQTGLDVVGRETGVPLSVALALVSDYEGEIDLRVPVEADLRSGEIRLGSLVAQAIRKALAAALTSPLRLLGSLFGTDGPPHAFAIDPVPFPAGGGALDAAGEERVGQIARILGSHPELVLVAKAQLSAADRQGLSPEEQQRLADERAGALRAALLGRAGGGILGTVRRAVGALRPGGAGPPAAPPIAENRVVVAPWSANENPSGDPLSGVYAELQAP